MEKRKKGLGRGLQALIDSEKSNIENQDTQNITITSEIHENILLHVDINSLIPNPYQARTVFNEKKLKELSSSISQHGVLQPIIITRPPEEIQSNDEKEKKYIIIAGERRWKASIKAGLTQIPALFINVNITKNMETSLTENIQRENLSPIEFAKSLNAYLEVSSYTHEEAAHFLGKSRSVITNSLRLLTLPPQIQDAIHIGDISQSHARLLLTLEKKEQLHILNEILSHSLNVRQTEIAINSLHTQKKIATSKKSSHSQNSKNISFIKEIEQNLIEKFGTKAYISGTMSEGKIVLHFYNKDDLQRLLEQLDISLS